jgi:Immunoglobulin-like domain of bacterial spore germination/Sporulation and spore germination
MSDYEPADRHEELLRRALRSEAEKVLPAGDGLSKIRARVRQPAAGLEWPWIGWARMAMVAGVAAAVAVVVAVSVIDEDEAAVIFQPAGRPSAGASTPSPSSTPEPTRTATHPSAPAPRPPASKPVPPTAPPAPGLAPGGEPAESGVVRPEPVYVYYLGETEQGLRLYREQRVVDVADGAVVRGALTAMFSAAPLDPDYRSLWPGGTAVRGISRSGATLTVDLSRAALDGTADAEAAELSLQQLVYTVTANYPDIRWVRLRVEGEPVSALWGHPVDGLLQRAPRADVQGPVWITRPDNGAELDGAVEFGGSASVFEATVTWEVRRDGEVVDEGFSTASAGAPEFGEWQARVLLPPGAYELRAYEASAEDGAPRFADTKTITVR